MLEQERDDMEVLMVRMQHLDFRNDKHKTPLHFAAMSGNIQWVAVSQEFPPVSIVAVVEEATARANRNDVLLFSQWASLSSYLYFSVVRFLVQNYLPSLTHVDDDCNTALHLAVHHGRTEVVAFLIREGAKVDARWEAL